MNVAGQHQFSHTPEQVWAALNDPSALAATLPGARRLEPTGDDEYAISVDVGVGSVKGTYDGTFALTDKVDGESCTVRASGRGRPGSVDVVARMRISPDALLTYEADATVTGPLAGVGQRLMAAAARRTTERFLAALDQYIAEPVAVEAGRAGAPAAAAEPGRAIEPARRAGDPRVIVVSALAGGFLALLGVAVGRWTARR